MIRFLFLAIFTSAIYGDGVYATYDVVPLRDASLNLSSSGVVKSIFVDVGDKVRRGALLLEIDNADIRASVELSRQKLNKSTIEEQFAKQSYERYKKVSDVIDAQLLDNQTLNYQKAKAEVAEAKASLQYNEALLEKTRLRAPFDGVIAAKNVEIGDFSSMTLFRLISSPDVKMVLNFDEKYLPLVKIGSQVNFSVDGKRHSVKITKLYPSINPKNRKATAEALYKNLTPGVFGEATIIIK